MVNNFLRITDNLHLFNHISRYMFVRNNKELTSIGVWASISHRKRPGKVKQLIREFVLKGFAVNALTTTTCSGWVSSLNHKIRNYPVKDYPIVVTFFC